MMHNNPLDKDAPNPNGSPTKAQNISPVKGLKAALSKHRVSQEPLPSLIKPVAKIKGAIHKPCGQKRTKMEKNNKKWTNKWFLDSVTKIHFNV